MTQPVLSILICSIPSRWDKARTLYTHIMELVGDKNIEVLLFMDNKKRSIGMKRQAIKDIANGKYFMFVDDDDWLHSVDEIYEACSTDVDVICFKSKCRNSDGSEYIVTMGLQYEVEHKSEEGRYVDCNRPPWVQCAWKRENAGRARFDDSNYGEDWYFVRHAIQVCQTQHFIDNVLHAYNFDPEVSEAVVGPKRCIVNVATGTYWKGQDRLLDSIRKYDPKSSGVFETVIPDNWLPHSENPYGFKIYMIEEMRGKYDQILWLDASVYAVKDPQPVWDWLTQHGIFMEEAGHMVGQWCNDFTLDYFKITREEAMKMPMLSAGFIGFDFRRNVANEFFTKWKESMEAGCFKGSHKDHRHDMTCASIIANQMGLVNRYSPGGQFFAYVGPGYGPPSETAVFHLAGIN